MLGPTDLDREMSPEDEAAFQALIAGDTSPMEVVGKREPAIDPLAMQRKKSMLTGAGLAPDDINGSLATPQSRDRDRADLNMAIPEDADKASLSSVKVDPYLRAHSGIATPEDRPLLPDQFPSGFAMPPAWAQQRADARSVGEYAPDPGAAVKAPAVAPKNVTPAVMPTSTPAPDVEPEAAPTPASQVQTPQPPAQPIAPDPMLAFAQAHAQPSMMSAPAISAAPTTTASGVAVPHAKPAFNTAELGLAMLADLALNRGRSVPSMIALGAHNEDTDWETQQRQMLADKNAAEIEHLKKAGITDPLTLMLRQQNYELQRERLGMQIGAEGRRTRAQQIKEDRARPDSPQSEAARQIAVKNGVPYDQVKDSSWDDIHSLYPSINKNLEATGAIGAATISHEVEKQAALTPGAVQRAGEIAAVTEPSKIRIAQAGAEARAQAQGDVQRDNKLENLEATRRAGEAELDAAFGMMEEQLQNRPAYAMPAQLVPDIAGRRVILPEQGAYNSAKAAAINAAEKMVTGGVPHADAVRHQLENLPDYATPGALESLRNIHSMINRLGEAGFEGIERVKRQAPTIRDRPQPRPASVENVGTAPVAPMPKDAQKPAAAAHAIKGTLYLPDGSKTKDTPQARQYLQSLGIGVQ